MTDYGQLTGLILLFLYGLFLLIIFKTILLFFDFRKFWKETRSLLKQIAAAKHQQSPQRDQGPLYDKEAQLAPSSLFSALMLDISGRGPFTDILMVREAMDYMAGPIRRGIEQVRYAGFISVGVALLCTLSAYWKSFNALSVMSGPSALQGWASGIADIVPAQALGTVSMLLSMSVSYIYRSRLSRINRNMTTNYLRTSFEDQAQSSAPDLKRGKTFDS